ncbi:uncharacterized protein CELE_Y37H9A.5 [Caenorhabditis elegans]|uniref:Uncharacterized protein n=1 Tax=Caenorhabditis elegans TaxID=6239 RepID=A5HW97_CAEEL|nr:Uncharacterized protein CELE_Y37H9A.5 [Caenorhabditis elegans]CAN86641.2 Uncharacterized protein CELE_Y37H9A.5 [Caenorhabditis elegans]|eukprot:NP_001122538.2 Uncharacterized protein CELE_Y37H9A.5 [Caenorhabditis elegans]
MEVEESHQSQPEQHGSPYWNHEAKDFPLHRRKSTPSSSRTSASRFSTSTM